MVVCRQRAKDEGIELEELVWVVVKALLVRAAQGDAAAAKLVLDRLCGRVPKAPAITPPILDHSTPVDSPVAEAVSFADAIQRLSELAEGMASE